MNIKYTLSFPDPHTHYLYVELHITGISTDFLNLKMAVWAPGSYLIREFQKNIDLIEWSLAKDQWTRAKKTNKNTWKIDVENKNEIFIRYKTYCFEYSVRTNFVDETHALVNGAATYVYAEGFENIESEIEIIPFPSWQHISTTLEQKDKQQWIRIAKSLDELLDSPIEIGNHISYFFDAAGVSHELAIYGHSNCNIEKLIADLKSIIIQEVKIFGSHPCKNYVFIIHHTESSYGGLEHLHSSVNHITRWSYTNEQYQRAISLLAHEYFHLWNVKRIRPASLIPFNYNEENYTDLLWFFEGVTSYYDDYICYRAGVTSKDDFIRIVEKNINEVVNNAGIDCQTLSEASFDTWLKYYRRNENSLNAHVNYYTHGAVVANLFDILIMDATNGAKSLDNVMQQLYTNYLTAPDKGVTEESILQVFNQVSGIDFSSYFNKYIHTTEPLELDFIFNLLGIRLKDCTIKSLPYLGMSTQWKENRLIITQVDKNYGAQLGGLSAEDEILAIDGIRVTKDFSTIYSNKPVNSNINVLISRNGILKLITITLTEDKRKKYIFELLPSPSEKQKLVYNKWLE